MSNPRVIVAILALTFVSSFLNVAQCEEQKTAPIDLEYPELIVTPSASDRLLMEAKTENSGRWLLHYPYQIPALTTMIGGLLTSGHVDTGFDTKEFSPKLGILTGVAWIGATVYLSATQKPYLRGYAQTKNLPTGTKREKLAKERLSEEVIEDQATLARRLNLISLATNLGASVYMFLSSEGGSTARMYNALSIIVSFTPFLFTHHWIDVANQHQEYKKKIYGPIAGIDLVENPRDQKVTPALSVSFRF